MRAVVLVGGFGTRLRPLTNTRPKQMLPIVNRPMIEHVVARLPQHGIDDVVLSMGYRPDAFAGAYPGGVCAGVTLHYAVEPEPLDTAGAIRFAARDAGIDERFLVLNGDVLTDLDLRALVAFHDARGAEGTFALQAVDDPSRFGVVPTGDDGAVLAFVEKPPRDEAPTNLINAGTYVLEPSVLDLIAGDRRVSIERETFPALVEGGQLYAMPTDDYWLDAGRPDLYLRANLDAIDGVRRARREQAIAADARVAGGARLEDSVVGAGASVAAGASVRRSLVMAGASIEHDAELDGTILGLGARVGAAARLDDCVIGDGVEVPAGAELAGVRIPEPA
jgi:mannose-1-phosphate guanylyltransferase